jgi:hypothetical protein
MVLYVVIDDKVHSIEVPPEMLEEGEEFFQVMDRDMDKGWQMSREWIDNPDQLARCQIAADRPVSAMATGNATLAQLMAAYMITRVPGIAAVDVDTGGEMLNTQVIMQGEWSQQDRRMSVEEAMVQAERDVSKIYKTGRNFHFAVRNPITGGWDESPPFAEEEQAQEARSQAVTKRQRELVTA